MNHHIIIKTSFITFTFTNIHVIIITAGKSHSSLDKNKKWIQMIQVYINSNRIIKTLKFHPSVTIFVFRDVSVKVMAE